MFVCLSVCLFKALLKKLDNLLRKLFQTFSKNKELLKRFETFEKMGKFIKKTVSNIKLFQKKDGPIMEKRRAQRAATGERSELPRVSAGASAASSNGRAQRAAKGERTEPATFYKTTSTQGSSGALPAGPLVLNNFTLFSFEVQKVGTKY